MKRFTVSIVKTVRSVVRDFEVEADSLNLAEQMAKEKAAYADFSEDEVDYEVTGIASQAIVIHTKRFTVEIDEGGASGSFEHDKLGDECGGYLLFEDGALVDYDGVAVLPREVSMALRAHGINVDQDFDVDDFPAEIVSDLQRHGIMI